MFFHFSLFYDIIYYVSTKAYFYVVNKMIKMLKNIVIVCGHYGSGKTNFSVNLAIHAANEGKKVTLIDLDIVNPYFRAADNAAELEAMGIKCIVPNFANTNVDVPSLPPAVMGALASANEDDRLTILDVGGDNGAVALGMYNRFLPEGSYDLLYVINKYRPLTEEAEDALSLLREIEYMSRLKATGVVNNSNLGIETTKEDVESTENWAKAIAKDAALPLFCTSFHKELMDTPDVTNPFPMANATKQIF